MAGDIQNYIRLLIANYENSENEENWDSVVITAADAEQQKCFEEQLKFKVANKELPGQLNYIILADPAGPILGAGGATLHVLQRLEDTFGKSLYSKKILIIHAGGFSKRLPSASCTGKLFCPLPVESQNGETLCILNLKLIFTKPFIKYMTKGGVFITGSDDIETFSLEGLDQIGPRLKGDGVVAIAHPSTIPIGETHGVYVLTPDANRSSCWISSSLEVLQKPKRMLMKEKGALLYGDDGQERVYTDSMFWCSPEVMQQLVKFALEYPDIYSTETCIYGDFLACMGQRPAREKIYCTKIAEKCPVKQEIALRFESTPLEVVVLEKSTFYHLGTMQEYVDHLQPESEFFQILGMKPIVAVDCQHSNKADIKGTVMNCVFAENVRVGDKSVIDHCIFDVPLVIGSGSIVSNCAVNSVEIDYIPSDWLFHTVPIFVRESVSYVTVAFRVNDDLKGRVETSQSWRRLGSHFDCPLWNASIFQPQPTMSGSFYCTWQLVNGSVNLDNTSDRISMADIIRVKHVPSFMEHKEAISKILMNRS